MTVRVTKPKVSIREELSDKNSFENYSDITSGRRNLIINGGFDIWQRATTATLVGGPGYVSADRWKIYVNTSTTMTLSRQAFTVGQVEVPGNPKYYARFDWLGTSSSTFFSFEQNIEGSYHGAGDYITVSFWARSEKSDDVTLGINQKFGTGGSSDQNVCNLTVPLTTVWKKYVYVVRVPSVSGKTINYNDDSLSMSWFRQGTVNSYLDISSVQVELGSRPTPFERRSVGEEFLACERYYQKLGGLAYQAVGFGKIYAAGQSAFGYCNFNTKMRTYPTVTEGGNGLIVTDRVAYDDTVTSVSGVKAGYGSLYATFHTGVTRSDRHPVIIASKNGASGWLNLEAEL